MQAQFKNFNEYQYSPEHILWLLDGDKANIQVKFLDGSLYGCQYGEQWWYLNDKLHRTDGPAIIFANGAQRWYLNDKEMTEKEHAAAVKKMKK